MRPVGPAKPSGPWAPLLPALPAPPIAPPLPATPSVPASARRRATALSALPDCAWYAVIGAPQAPPLLTFTTARPEVSTAATDGSSDDVSSPRSTSVTGFAEGSRKAGLQPAPLLVSSTKPSSAASAISMPLLVPSISATATALSGAVWV